jgi:NAD(P)-dependent dehydrogenase (short-subunit alcohol dehydrogenase family)
MRGNLLGEEVTADDVARAVLFFSDRDNSFVTGQTLYVCGGSSVGTLVI